MGCGVQARAFALACAARGLAHRKLSRNELDIADPDAVAAAVAGLRPWTVVNAAAYGDVDGAEQHPAACIRANALGPAVLAEACAKVGVRLVTFYSGLVFDGAPLEPYLEHDPAHPLSVYGRAKAEGERLVLVRYEGAMVVRAGKLFVPDKVRGLAARTLRSLERGEGVQVPGD